MTEAELIEKLQAHYAQLHPETIKAVRELLPKVKAMSQTDVVALWLILKHFYKLN